jgi:hypothetical protein
MAHALSATTEGIPERLLDESRSHPEPAVSTCHFRGLELLFEDCTAVLVAGQAGTVNVLHSNYPRVLLCFMRFQTGTVALGTYTKPFSHCHTEQQVKKGECSVRCSWWPTR